MKSWKFILLLTVCMQASAEFENIQLTTSTAYCGEPSIAVNGATVGIVYEGYSTGNDEIFLLTSTNGGASFAPPVRITTNDSDSWRPKIAVNDGFDLVWEDRRSGKREVYYTRYAGGNLGVTLKISGGNVYSAFPSLASDNRDLFISWEDYRDGNDEIYFRKYVGGVWSPEKRLTNNDSTSWGSDIALDPVTQKLHLAFFDYRTGNDEVYYLSSGDKGETWTTEANISNDAANSWEPRVAAYNGIVAGVWYSWDGATASYEVYYSEKNGDGAFTPAQRISESGSDSKCPSISMDALSVIVTWEDFRDGNDEIYLARKAHGSGQWSYRRITVDSSDSFGADAAFCGSEILVPWFDYRTGMDQIWFAKGPLEGGTIVEKSRAIPRQSPGLTAAPNPFHHRTRISLVAPPPQRHGKTNLRVLDLQGRLVHSRTLPEEEMAKGVEWNAGNLPAGIYLLETSFPSNIIRSRVILLP